MNLQFDLQIAIKIVYCCLIELWHQSAISGALFACSNPIRCCKSCFKIILGSDSTLRCTHRAQAAHIHTSQGRSWPIYFNKGHVCRQDQPWSYKAFCTVTRATLPWDLGHSYSTYAGLPPVCLWIYLSEALQVQVTCLFQVTPTSQIHSDARVSRTWNYHIVFKLWSPKRFIKEWDSFSVCWL